MSQPNKRPVWIFFLISGLPLIALILLEKSNVTIAVLVLLVIVGIPVFLIFQPIVRYGKRHGWCPTQYAWMQLVGGIVLAVVFAELIWKYPLDVILPGVAMIGVPSALVIIGMSRKTTKGKAMWLVAAVIAGLVLIITFAILGRPGRSIPHRQANRDASGEIAYARDHVLP